MNTVPGQAETTTGSPRDLYSVATATDGRHKHGRADPRSVFQKRRHQSHDSGQASGQNGLGQTGDR